MSGLDALIGQVVGGRYRIERLLGKGGFGAVFAATHLELLRPVAVKVLMASAQEGDALLARFRREARLQDELRHPAIVKLRDFGRREDGLCFMVQELVEGRTLDAVVAGGPVAPGRAVRLVCGVLEGLAEAHWRGIVHRDLKPANIMVVDGPGGEEVRILDFGIAKGGDLGEESASITQTGQLLGTPAFMAPEQIEQQRVTAATDLYAMGVVLFVLLTGRRPFVGSLRAVLTAHLVRPVPALPEGLPVGLGAVVARAMAKDPGGRFGSAGEMRAALLGVLEGVRVRGETTAVERVGPGWRGAVELDETAVTPTPSSDWRGAVVTGGGDAGGGGAAVESGARGSRGGAAGVGVEKGAGRAVVGLAARKTARLSTVGAPGGAGDGDSGDGAGDGGAGLQRGVPMRGAGDGRAAAGSGAVGVVAAGWAALAERSAGVGVGNAGGQAAANDGAAVAGGAGAAGAARGERGEAGGDAGLGQVERLGAGRAVVGGAGDGARGVGGEAATVGGGRGWLRVAGLAVAVGAVLGAVLVVMDGGREVSPERGAGAAEAFTGQAQGVSAGDVVPAGGSDGAVWQFDGVVGVEGDEAEELSGGDGGVRVARADEPMKQAAVVLAKDEHSADERRRMAEAVSAPDEPARRGLAGTVTVRAADDRVKQGAVGAGTEGTSEQVRLAGTDASDGAADERARRGEDGSDGAGTVAWLGVGGPDGVAGERARVTSSNPGRRRGVERSAKPGRAAKPVRAANDDDGKRGGSPTSGRAGPAMSRAMRPDADVSATSGKQSREASMAEKTPTMDATVASAKPAAVVPATATADIAIDALGLRFDRALRAGDCEGASRLLAAARRYDAGRDWIPWVERLTEVQVLGRCQQRKEGSQ